MIRRNFFHCHIKFIYFHKLFNLWCSANRTRKRWEHVEGRNSFYIANVATNNSEKHFYGVGGNVSLLNSIHRCGWSPPYGVQLGVTQACARERYEIPIIGSFRFLRVSRLFGTTPASAYLKMKRAKSMEAHWCVNRIVMKASNGIAS